MPSNTPWRVCLSWFVWPHRRRLFPIVALAATVMAHGAEMQPETKLQRSDFMPAVELAPFVVKGEKLSISILARSKADRRYAEKFSEDVMEVIFATLEKSAGAGLVIIGEEGEPHPVFVFRKFIELAKANQLDPAVAARAQEAGELMRQWERRLNLDAATKDGLPVEAFLKALPLPLEGISSKLYQIAWAEGFDEKRVEQKLRSLTPADLAGDQLSRFNWVFYLPPREAFGEVMKALVPLMMKKEKMGLLKRAAVRSAVVVFMPAIKKAVEGARKGMLFMTVMRARSGYTDDDIQRLTGAYVRVLMPDFKFNDSSTQQRAIDAIEAQKVANAEYAKDPFISPQRLTEFDPAVYAKFEGDYAEKSESTYHFARSEGGFTWRYRNLKPQPFYPAGDRLFVSENGRTTIGFLVDEAGNVTGVEQRSHRQRRTFPRTVAAPSDMSPPREAKAAATRDAATPKP